MLGKLIDGTLLVLTAICTAVWLAVHGYQDWSLVPLVLALVGVLLA